ncbi:MAG: transporter substrate-binding domain-containing protein [Candidatus Thiodiazotropha sp.]|nr:transporter substrate-binding domain-containing protein [Candidatus Thiodiazotropha sp.]MCM8884535.1 transporter substrate-binding domain-containing protein [Candidatus Thiodiazotropha sp.]
MQRCAVNKGWLLLLFIILLITNNTVLGQPSDTLRIGIYNNPPLVTTDQKGHPGGLFIEILQQIATQEGWALSFVAGTWSDQLHRLSMGKIDLLPAIAINDTRRQRFLFIDQTVIANWAQIFVPEDSNIQSVPDLNGKRIAVLRDDVYITGDSGLNEICKSFYIICELTEYATYDRVLRAVAQGKADAGLVNRLFGATRGHLYTPIASPIVLMPLDIRLAISRASPNAEIIQRRIDHHLAIMKADDLSIYHQYLSNLFEPRVAVLKTPNWIFQAALIAGLVIAALLIISQLLSK